MIDASQAEPCGVRISAAAEALRSALSRGLKAQLTVSGTCMAPLVLDGDVVYLEPIKGIPPVGTLVVDVDPTGAAVCHRVVAHRGGEVVVLCGDRSSVLTECPVERLVGLVEMVERSGRRILVNSRVSGKLSQFIAILHSLELRNRRDKSFVFSPVALAFRCIRELTVLSCRTVWFLTQKKPG